MFQKRINDLIFGIVFRNKKFIYLAPLYSPKEQHFKYYTNKSFIRMYDLDNNYIGLIRLCNMIPVPKTQIIYNVNISNNIFFKENQFIRLHETQIRSKAKYIYNTKEDFYKKLIPNFKKLELISLLYNTFLF